MIDLRKKICAFILPNQNLFSKSVISRVSRTIRASVEANEQIDFNFFKKVFAEYFYLIIADNPGFGESDPPPRIWSFIDYAKFFNAFVKQIGTSKPIIMGKSWAGGIALTYAVNFPNHTKALILVNSGTNEDAILLKVRKS